MPDQPTHRPPVVPKTADSFHDLMPDEMLVRNMVIEKIRRVCEIYGYVPLQTPAVERLDVLQGTAGAEVEESIIRVVTPREEKKTFGLRFDLTVPLARLVAQSAALSLPFRRYQVGTVWRAHNDPREFTQFDIDSMGVESELADAEVIMAMCDILQVVDAGPYIVRFSSRVLLKLLLELAHLPETMEFAILKVLSRREEHPVDWFRDTLMRGYKDRFGDRQPGLQLKSSHVQHIENFLAILSKSRKETLRQLRALFAPIEGAQSKLDVLERISDQLDALGYGSNVATIDVTVFRNLTYYTGPIFEGVLLDGPRPATVIHGGRYDFLAMRFFHTPIAATGTTVDVDRLIAAMRASGKIRAPDSVVRVLVTNIDNALTSDCMQMTWQLRNAGIPTQIYLGSDRKLLEQLRYAASQRIPIALLYGPDEAVARTVSIKHMNVGEQVTVARGHLVDTVRRLLGYDSPP